ncbi:rhodanese-like domain-containing protein [Effusibacillus dendaii]|uniref:Rhodanese domain-containing protein n=1 Tax=Effusibacillus dendaii TaxID=2743772 RepID=A0A7I8DEI3_9BACL|nr:rhodanese-like domain-containing protein [Effusibacillus dendaii]BCJ88447.1 hypothetical protein skT53_34320 [Effusibacillus dendaii]
MQENKAEEKHIEPKEFLRKMQGGELDDAFLLDVREPFEWSDFHLDKAVLIPMHTIPARIHEIPRDKPVYCLCAHGIRSYYTTMYLLENSYSDVTNVRGGMCEIERYMKATGAD